MLFANHKRIGITVPVLFAIAVLAAVNTTNAFAGQETKLFVPGEVLVKFKHKSDQDKLLSEALRSKQDKLKVLAPVARLLSRKTKMPLTIKQLLSGRWVLLSIEPKKLTAGLVKRLRQKNSIQKVKTKASDDKSLNSLALPAIDIAFKQGSREFKIVAFKLKGVGDKDFTGLIDEIADSLGLPVQGQVNQNSHLILQLDPLEMTLTMEKRLRSLTLIIDAAQLNYISTAM